MVRMKVLVYLQMASLVSSLVIRVPERSKRDSGRNICKEESVTIYPEVAQNTEGQIKFIVQRNATHSSLQPVDITTCIHPGSSCSGCSTKHSPVLPTVCSNKYKELRLYARGNSWSDVGYDLFRFPTGCDCFTLQ